MLPTENPSYAILVPYGAKYGDRYKQGMVNIRIEEAVCADKESYTKCTIVL